MHRNTSKDTNFKKTSKDSVIKRTKNELETSKTESSKKTSLTKKTEPNKIVERNNHKASSSTKNANLLMKQSTVKGSKPHASEKDSKLLNKLKVTSQEHLQNVNISKAEFSDMKVESSKDDATDKSMF